MGKKKEEKVTEEVKEEIKEEKVEEAPVEEKVEEKVEEVKVETTPTPTPVAPPKKKSHTGLIIAIVCAAVIIPIAIVVIIVALLFNAYMGKNETHTAKVEKPVKESAYKLTGNGLENFDLYFLQLENKEKNMIYSPLSIKYALAMLNEGTDGRSHEEIENLIGDYKPKKYNNNDNMAFANAMYIRNTFQKNIKDSYTKTLQDKYGAEVKIEDFQSAKPMNDWISNRTFGLISDLLDDDTVSEENFILINALAIDMNWNNQLQCKDGRTIPCLSYYVKYDHENYDDSVHEIFNDFDKVNFNGKDVDAATIGASINRYDIIKELGADKIREEVGAELQTYIDNGGEMCGETHESFMNTYMEELGANYKRVDKSTDFLFNEDDDVKAFAKDLKTYNGVTLQYVAIMPKTESLTKYIKDVDADKVSKVVKGLKEIELDSFKDGVVTRVHGSIPFFKYDYELDLMNDLESLGVESVFDINKADLSKMLQDEKQFIGEASHKATIEFSNDGIKAAAVTTMGGMGAAGCYIQFDHEYKVPVEEIDLTFDKPYMYIIRDKDTGEVWFTGSVYNPAE